MEWVKTEVEQGNGYRNEKPIVSKLMINFDYEYEEERERIFKDFLRFPTCMISNRR